MPVVKLLDAAATNTTGAAFYLGRSKGPYTIRTSGGYSVVGVQIETSSVGEYVDGGAPTGAAFVIDFGWVGGGATGTIDPADQPAALVGLADKTIAQLDHRAKFIRAVYPVGGTGTATVVLEMEC